MASARLLQKLALLVLVSVLCLAFTELTIRMVIPQPPSWLNVYRHHPDLPLFTLQPNVERLVDTGESRWTVLTDTRGFRVSRNHKPGAELPLAVWLGDSFTFGHGVDHAQTWVGLLNSAGDRSYRFVNTGVVKYGPVQYRQVLEYLLEQRLAPKMVLVGIYLGNDFYDVLLNRDLPVINGIIRGHVGLKSTIKQHSHAYRLAAKIYHQMLKAGTPLSGPHEGYLYNPESWNDGLLKKGLETFRTELNKIAKICRAESIDLFVMIIPPRAAVEATHAGSSAQTHGQRANFTLPIEQASTVLRDLGIRYLDLTPILAQHNTTETYFRFDGHFTPLAHRLVFEALQPRLREISHDSSIGEPASVRNPE